MQELADTYGFTAFLLVPLSCAGEDHGVLLLAANTPSRLRRHVCRLAEDLGAALGQALYTLSCISHFHAGEQIIKDIMPEKVSCCRCFCGCSVWRNDVASRCSSR